MASISQCMGLSEILRYIKLYIKQVPGFINLDIWGTSLSPHQEHSLCNMTCSVLQCMPRKRLSAASRRFHKAPVESDWSDVSTMMEVLRRKELQARTTVGRCNGCWVVSTLWISMRSDIHGYPTIAYNCHVHLEK